MIKQFLVVGLLLALVFGSVFGWKQYQATQLATRLAAGGAPLVSVSSTEVTLERWQRKVNAVGSLRAIQGVEVSPEVPGIVAEIHFESGHHVEAGAVLVQLDATAEHAELRSLQAQLELARQDYERARGLEVKTVLSQAQLDRAKSVLDSLAAQAEEQQALIARKTLRAPFSGELGIREINLGEYLSPGTPIVTLQKLNPIFVDFTVPERYLQTVHVGQPVAVVLAAFEDEAFNGEITAISPKVASETRNIDLQATLSNPGKQLRPGMFSRVSVLLGEADEVLTLPRVAVDFLPYGNSVFVIEGEGEDLKVYRRQVSTGRIQGNMVEITSGLTPGQSVVNTGQLKLRNGQRVSIDNSVELPVGTVRG